MGCLIVDTCALLDLVRAPSRTEIRAGHIEAARHILQAIEATGSEHQLMVSHHVHREFGNHIDDVVQETRVKLQRVVDSWHHAVAVRRAQGANANAPLSSDLFEAMDAGASLARRLIAASSQIALDKQDEELAFARVVQRRAPARQGKDSTIDCAILEGALRVARTKSERTVFLTSNKEDFSSKSLETDLEASGLQLALDWGHAWYLMQRLL